MDVRDQDLCEQGAWSFRMPWRSVETASQKPSARGAHIGTPECGDEPARYAPSRPSFSWLGR